MEKTGKLQDFFLYKDIKLGLSSQISKIPALITKEDPHDTKEFYANLSTFLEKSRISLSFTAYSFATFLMSSLKEADFSETTLKLCENIASATQRKILVFLLKNENIEEILFLALSQEKTEEINVNFLNFCEFLSLIISIKPDLSSKHGEILRKKLEIIIKSFVENSKKSEKNMINSNFLSFFLEFLWRILDKIEVFTEELSENLWNLMNFIEETRILRVYLYSKKKSSSMDSLRRLHDKIEAEIFANTANILLIFYTKNEFFPKKHAALLREKLEDFMRFYRFIYRKNRKKPEKYEKKQRRGFIDKFLKLALFIQDDYFLRFSLRFLRNLACFSAFSGLKTCKKHDFVGFIVKSMDYNVVFTVEFLMKDALFLELLVKMVNLLCEENEKIAKNSKLSRFFKNLLKKLKLKKNQFLYKIEPLLKKIEFMLDFHIY